jgi:hypothetical protein
MAKPIISLEVVNFDKELARIKREVAEIGAMETHARIDYATEQLRIVTPVDTGEARRGWSNTKTRTIFGEAAGTIRNPVEHIEYLNNGSSQQAPKYFIEAVLLTIGELT